jgi:hypothetical protein
MSDDLEQLLSDGLRRRAAQVHLEPGLGARAHRQHRRTRNRTRSAVALGATATIGVAAGAAALTAQNQPAGIETAKTAAYVISHSEQALAKAAANDPVITLRSQDWGQGVGFGMNPATALHWQQTDMWFHDNQMRTEGLTSAGQPVYDFGTDQRTETNVDYPAKVWWRGAGTTSATPPSTKQLTCEDVRYFGVDGSPEQYAADIRKALSCGLYTTDGTEQVNGTEAIKLVPVKPENNAPTAILWLDPSTYLPMKIAMETVAGGQMTLDHTEYIDWLPPTPANLAELTPPVPAGFTQIPPPPALSGCNPSNPACMQDYQKKSSAWYSKYLKPTGTRS